MIEKRYGKKVDDIDDTIINITENGNDFAWFLNDDYTNEQVDKIVQRLNELYDKLDCHILLTDQERQKVSNFIKGIEKENEQLKYENERLTAKLNKTALELVDDVISQGKATEISEMSYREFLDYRAKNGKPMELQL